MNNIFLFLKPEHRGQDFLSTCKLLSEQGHLGRESFDHEKPGLPRSASSDGYVYFSEDSSPYVQMSNYWHEPRKSKHNDGVSYSAMRLAGASTFASFKPTFKRSNLYSITVQYGDKIVPGAKLPKDNRYLINTEYMKLYEYTSPGSQDLEFDAASGLPVDGSNWKTYDLLYCDRVTTED